jgi:hypothetical protein
MSINKKHIIKDNLVKGKFMGMVFSNIKMETYIKFCFCKIINQIKGNKFKYNLRIVEYADGTYFEGEWKDNFANG